MAKAGRYVFRRGFLFGVIFSAAFLLWGYGLIGVFGEPFWFHTITGCIRDLHKHTWWGAFFVVTGAGVMGGMVALLIGNVKSKREP